MQPESKRCFASGIWARCWTGCPVPALEDRVAGARAPSGAAFAFIAPYLLHLRVDRSDAYRRDQINLGRVLLLGLEFLVAADIVRTVALDPTLLSVSMLGLLIVVRTFFSWSLVVEIEGRWPWRARSAE